MDTAAPAESTQPGPAFSFWRWLILTCLMLLPLGILVSLMILAGGGLFEYFIQIPWLTYFFVLLVAFLGGFLQWIYFHFQFRRAWTWPLVQVLVYGLITFAFTGILQYELYLLTRNFPVWVRLGSSALVLLAFLLPPALVHFGYFRLKHIPLGWGWFRDYALVFAFGLAVFLVYDWFTEGRASPIQVAHGGFYTGMIVFALYLSAGQGWVLARVQFPGLPKKVKKGKTTEVVTAQKDQNQEGKNEESESVT
jgi:hypothetical protein